MGHPEKEKAGAKMITENFSLQRPLGNNAHAYYEKFITLEREPDIFWKHCVTIQLVNV